MPPIAEGQVFPTLQAFKTALREWAIERNWTPHILDSDSHRVRAGCRSSPGCSFRIRANYSTKRCDAKVTRVDDIHTCEPFANPHTLAHQNIKRAETGKLKFLREVVPQMMTVTLETNVQDIIDVVEKKYGQKIPTRQAQKVKSSLTERVKGPCRNCHMVGHTRRQCPQLRASAPGPIDFSADGELGFPNGGQDPHSATYADGGLEEDDDMNFDAHNPHLFHAHPQTATNGGYTQAHISNAVEAYGLDHDAPHPYGSMQIPPPPPSTRPQPVTPQPNVAAETPTPRTPAETRLKAARMLDEAAKLMEEAAQLNREAARLHASVANV